MSRWTAIVVSPLALLVGSGAVAQEGAPTIVTPRAELEGLQFTEFDGAVEFEWRRDVDDVDTDGTAPEGGSVDRLREILELGTRGFVGHPNLLELDLRGRIWLEQRWFDSVSSDASNSDQTLYEWNLQGNFIAESDLPFTLYSQQSINDIDRDFGGTLENRFRETGVRGSVRSDFAPTNVRLFQRETEQRDPALSQDFNIHRDTVEADGQLDLSEQQQLAWDAGYDNIDESGDLRQTRSVERFEANATHTVEFGDTGENSLRTRARYYNETGDRNLRQINFDPRLRLRHSSDLSSWYDYAYSRSDRPEQEQTSNRATANVRHELFDSLTSIGTLGYETLDVPTDDFDSEEIFGRADIQYRKQVPYGQFTAALDVNLSRLEQSTRGAPIAVADDIYIFNAANLIVINQRNILVSSIVVTDVGGIIVYSENIDYIVRGFPDHVEIQRLAGGNIAPNQAVAIDYVVGAEPGGTTDTTGVGIDVRYTFEETFLEGVSMYFQHYDQDENRSFSVDQFPENDFRDTRYGIEYSRWKVYARAEYQKRSSTITPFNATRFEGRYIERLGPGSSLVFSGIYQQVDRDLDLLTTRTTTLTGQWNQRFQNRLNLALIVRYQWSDDNRDFESEAFEQQLDMNWSRGRTEIYAQLRNSFNDSTSSDRTVQRFVVGVRREF